MTNTLKQLAAAGTSPWLDNIRRGWLVSGEFRRMVDEGIVGVTSNPTIFQKAIADSTDYDTAVAALAASGSEPGDAFFELAIADVREAADQIRAVYDATGHLDGYVSFELPPAMANDTAKSIAAAPEFFERIGRPNIYIKIPGTAEGVPAIEETIAAGINVNVTLLFSLKNYEAIHEAYIRGLERRVEAGEPISDIYSVASFFVSRVDTAVDAQLPDDSPLRGKAAVANAKLAYQRFGEITGSDRWRALAEKGANVQRPLWASTGTKNPAYSDILYVDEPDRPRLREHDARGHDRGVPRSRHRPPHGRRRTSTAPAACWSSSRRPGSAWTRSRPSSRPTAWPASRHRSTR